MTRPRAAAAQSVARLSGSARVIYAPLVEIVATGATVDLAAYAGVIFTSANGVAMGPDGHGMDAYCVGQRTASRAQDRGWHVILTEPNAAELVQNLIKKASRAPLAHLCGQHRRGEIAARLSDAGTSVVEHVLYDQPLRPLSEEARRAIAGEASVILPLFSPRTAAHLAAELGHAPQATVLAISDAVARALGAVSFREVLVAAAPNGDEMARSIDLWLHRDRLS